MLLPHVSPDHSNLYDSFAKYCEAEVLEGTNQYRVEGHGLQVGALDAHVN